MPVRARGTAADIDAPHGTTIVALTFDGGVVMAGDRRATMGNIIAQRDIEKVYPADEYSAVGIAGTAGLAIELVRLLQVELEHYEKIEGTTLSLTGKANRLATMIRGNLAMAMQGLAVVPLFAGYDHETSSGRIFSYDVTGGRYEEHSFHAVGSGGFFARGSLKKLYRSQMPEADAVHGCRRRRSTTPPTTTRRPVVPTSCGGSSRWCRSSPPTATAACRTPRSARSSNAWSSARNERPDGPAAPLT